jgi:hypothetical protein
MPPHSAPSAAARTSSAPAARPRSEPPSAPRNPPPRKRPLPLTDEVSLSLARMADLLRLYASVLFLLVFVWGALLAVEFLRSVCPSPVSAVGATPLATTSPALWVYSYSLDPLLLVLAPAGLGLLLWGWAWRREVRRLDPLGRPPAPVGRRRWYPFRAASLRGAGILLTSVLLVAGGTLLALPSPRVPLSLCGAFASNPLPASLLASEDLLFLLSVASAVLVPGILAYESARVANPWVPPALRPALRRAVGQTFSFAIPGGILAGAVYLYTGDPAVLLLGILGSASSFPGVWNLAYTLRPGPEPRRS